MLPPSISICICTCRRAKILAQTLPQLARLRGLSQAQEILIIENSNDSTSLHVVEKYRSQFPCPVRYEQQYALGISHARNKALYEAQGAIIAFLDDDCLPAENWFENILRFLETHDGESWALVGGRVRSDFIYGKPTWVNEQVLSYFSHCDWGEEERALASGEHWLPEGNCFLQKEPACALGGFNTLLGHRGKTMISHEGNDLRQRLEEAGYVTYYCPSLEVTHLIHERERYHKRWLYKRAFRGGMSETQMGAISEDHRPYLTSHLKALLHPNNLFSLLRRDTPIEKKCSFYYQLGFLIGCYKLKRLCPRLPSI